MRKGYIFLIIMLIFISFSINVLAEESGSGATAFGIRELKSLEMYSYYLNETTADVNYSFPLWLNSSDYADGISKWVNVKFRVINDRLTAKNTYGYMYVNGNQCLPFSYPVASPTGQYVRYFDCTNVLTNTTLNVSYNITWLLTENSRNIIILFYPTYVNNPIANYTNMSEAIWNYTNRNLTYYPNNTDIILNNITSQLNNITNQLNNIFTNFTTEFSLIPYNVWNYTTRILTINIPELVWEYGGLDPIYRNVTATNITANITSLNITTDISNKAIIKIISAWCVQYPKLCKE